MVIGAKEKFLFTIKLIGFVLICLQVIVTILEIREYNIFNHGTLQYLVHLELSSKRPEELFQPTSPENVTSYLSASTEHRDEEGLSSQIRHSEDDDERVITSEIESRILQWMEYSGAQCVVKEPKECPCVPPGLGW